MLLCSFSETDLWWALTKRFPRRVIDGLLIPRRCYQLIDFAPTTYGQGCALSAIEDAKITTPKFELSHRSLFRVAISSYPRGRHQ